MKFDAIILAGGQGRRLGGVDKAAIVVAGETLLERALKAAEGAQRVIVVGPERDVSRAIAWTSERPPGGGPVAALAAGVASVASDVVVVLAVDHPFADRRAVARLLASVGGCDGAVIVDADGRPALVAAYRTRVLRRRFTELGDLAAASMKQFAKTMTLARVLDAQAAIDLDTEDDLLSLSSALGGEVLPRGDSPSPARW